MKYVIDVHLLLTLARGDRNVTFRMPLYSKSDVGVPQHVIVHVSAEVRRLARKGPTKRWEMLLPVLPRLAWTNEVTDVLLALERTDADAIVVAHAKASSAAILTTNPAAYEAWPDAVLEPIVFEGKSI